MKKNWNAFDTEQINRLKNYAISGVYCYGGDIYKLLDTKKMHLLVKKIKNGTTDASKLVFGKEKITLEERFLENVDKYIGFVRDKFYFNSVEQALVIEESLTNNYSSILLCEDNCHSAKNQYEKITKYCVGFIRMFVFNFYKNIMKLAQIYDSNECTIMMYEELSKLNFNDDEDIYKIGDIFEQVLCIRKNNVFNCFIDVDNMDDVRLDFYAMQIEWCLNDYFTLRWSDRFKVSVRDNIIITDNHSIILFNILKYEKLKKEYKIEFGIQNENFTGLVNDFTLTESEMNILRKRLKNNILTDKKSSEYYTDKMSFLDSKINLIWWKDSMDYEFVEVEFYFGNSTDFYNLSLERKDIVKLYDLIEKEIKAI